MVGYLYSAFEKEAGIGMVIVMASVSFVEVRFDVQGEDIPGLKSVYIYHEG